jgi:DNA-binding transcriptional regulator YhcF (GntR family)
MALSSCKIRAALKNHTTGRSAKSYRELGQKIQVHHNTVKKYLTKMGVHHKTKKSAPKTTARQQSVIKARLKLLTQNFFSAKSIHKYVMDEKSYSRLTAMSGNSKVIMSMKITLQKRLSIKAVLPNQSTVNKELYISKCLPVYIVNLSKNTTKRKKNRVLA